LSLSMRIKEPRFNQKLLLRLLGYSIRKIYLIHHKNL